MSGSFGSGNRLSPVASSTVPTRVVRGAWQTEAVLKTEKAGMVHKTFREQAKWLKLNLWKINFKLSKICKVTSMHMAIVIINNASFSAKIKEDTNENKKIYNLKINT